MFYEDITTKYSDGYVARFFEAARSVKSHLGPPRLPRHRWGPGLAFPGLRVSGFRVSTLTLALGRQGSAFRA